MRDCFNCKYEPEWSGMSDHPKYPSRTGRCKWDKKLPAIPAVISISRPRLIVIYSDNSGVEENCKAWEGK